MSRKQKIVTKDSTEAELVALSDTISFVEQCDNFMREQGMRKMKFPIFLQENVYYQPCDQGMMQAENKALKGPTASN